MVGMVLTGVFASPTVNAAVVEPGLFYRNKFIHKTSSCVSWRICIRFLGSYILLYITNLITPLRVNEEYEKEGLDKTQHGESL
jgi:Amt family ammonium transporter